MTPVPDPDRVTFLRKYKLPNHQNGQVYLTSHRICYIDKAEPRKHSVALDLKDVERYEFYVCISRCTYRHVPTGVAIDPTLKGGFLKSSPKITLIPKPTKRSSLQPRSLSLAGTPSRSSNASPPQHPDGQPRVSPVERSPASTATWVCTICSFSNPVPSNFDPTTANAHTPLAPCLACGIKPTLTHVLKATISNATSRQPGSPALQTPLPVRPRPASDLSVARGSPSGLAPAQDAPPRSSDPDSSFQCPRCTFLNHPSLLSCEMCGGPLISHDVPVEATQQARTDTESPGPFLNALSAVPPGLENPENIKISFRGGGEKIFHERLKGSVTQRKWLLQGAPPIPKSSRPGETLSNGSATDPGTRASRERPRIGGIAGLEHRGQAMRKNNELVIGSAFEDLEALMASAKEIVALADNFARQVKGASGGSSASENALLADSVSQLGLITTKDIVGSSSSGSDSLYLSELARTLAEFLTDDRRGVLKKAGGIISLVDLWAVFNRARGGVELVSPADFEKAVNMWEKLGLPVRLRTFKSGVKVVQGRDRTDETTIRALLSWLSDLHEFPPEREVPWDWRMFGRGVTARDVAERFGWSIGVAEEELEMAEERGVLCREEGIEGVKFWENFIDTGDSKGFKDLTKERQDMIARILVQ